MAVRCIEGPLVVGLYRPDPRDPIPPIASHEDWLEWLLRDQHRWKRVVTVQVLAKYL